MTTLRKYKFVIFLLALLILLAYPFLSLLLLVSEPTMHVTSFSILIFASFLLANRKIPKYIVLFFGLITFFALWCEHLSNELWHSEIIRIYSSFFFFCGLIYMLTRNFIDAKSISLQVILGAMAGYILLGFLGGTTFEMMEFHHPESLKLSAGHMKYDYYYFSFISLVTVGYGDIIPVSYPAKSLSIILSVLGQFYLAIGIASFVGKLMKN